MTFSTAALLHRGLDHLLHVLHPATILHGRGKEDDAREVLLLLYGHGQVVGQILNTKYLILNTIQLNNEYFMFTSREYNSTEEQEKQEQKLMLSLCGM